MITEKLKKIGVHYKYSLKPTVIKASANVFHLAISLCLFGNNIEKK